MTMRTRIVLIVAVALVGGRGLTRWPVASAQPQAQTPSVAGQSATRLPDGRWLLLGGERDGGIVRAAAIFDPRTGATIRLDAGMTMPRAGHTATLLPDGSVLITGGRGPLGQVAPVAELFDPQADTFVAVAMPGGTPRAGHTATLLVDGRVLIAGGTGDGGGIVPEVEIWDVTGQRVETAGRLRRARTGQQATLLRDGTVTFSAGAATDEIFDPSTGRSVDGAAPGDDGAPAHIASSIPVHEAIDVAVDMRVALLLSRPLQAETVTAATVTLTGSEGEVEVRVVAAEGGRLVFVTPRVPLQYGSTYTLTMAGASDRAGQAMAAASIGFMTVDEPRPPTDVRSDEETWVPGDRSRREGWKAERPPSPWESLEPLMAPPGTTAISGRVLTLDGRPLAGVSLSVEGSDAVRSDRTGRFLLVLEAAATARQVLHIDGAPASRGNRRYGFFEYGSNVVAGRTNVLPFTIWMPKLDLAHQVSIPSTTMSEVVVTTPFIPGLELHLPPGTTIVGRDGKPVRTIGITAIPVDRPPFPLAKNVDVPVYFTVQPGGAYVRTSGAGPKGAWLVYPNYRQAPIGKRVQFFHYDPDVRDWYVYGPGTVLPGGAQVMPDPKTRIYEFTGAMINSGPSPPTDGDAPNCCPANTDGDPVGLATGLFTLEQTDLDIPDTLPVAVTRTYRSRDQEIRAFGPGTTHPYAMFLYSEHQYSEADLVLPDGAKLHYVRLSPGTGWTDAVFAHQETATTSATPTQFYKSTMIWNGNGWNVTLKDGTVYVFGENAPLQAIRDRFGNQITIAHSNGQSGNVTQVTSPNGRWIAFTYDTSNRVTQVKDNIGRTVGYQYDSNGNLWKVTDPMGQIIEYTYDAEHNMTSVKNRNGVVYVTNQYTTPADAPTPPGWVKKQTFVDTGFYAFAYTFGSNGKVTQTDVTDPIGAVRRVTFNANGYVLQDTRALGLPEEQITSVLRPLGNNFAQTITDPRMLQTTMTYDAVGNLRSVTRLANTANPVTTQYTYEPRFNQIKTVEDALHHVTTYDYDEVGHLTTITDPLQHTTTFGYNSRGQQTSITDGLQHTTTFGYTGGDLATVTDPLNRVMTRFTDAVGRVVRTTNALGNATRYAYDANDRVTSILDAAGGQTSFDYFPDGQVHTVTDANQHPTVYTVDSLGRVASRTDPLQRSETFTYDLKGRLSGHTNRNGQLTVRTYDAHDRLATMTFADQSVVTYVRDDAGRLTHIQDSANGETVREYDDLDRVASEMTDRGTIAYTYDAAGRRETSTITGQPPVVYTYDDADRLKTITQGTTATALEYDDAGRRVLLTLPNGTSTAYAYDAASQMASITYKAGAVTLGDLSYTYDAIGRRVEVGGSFARTGLPQPQAGSTFDAANRLVQWNGGVLSYDADGNLRSTGLDNFTWNARGQLAGTTIGSTTFGYDGTGRRAAKVAGSATTRYMYDGASLVQELNGASPIASRLMGSDIDESFARTSASGTATPLTDALGSTIAETNSSGAITARYTYEPFGRVAVSGATTGDTARFTGREDDGSGLYFYRARYYSPQLQRFLSEDPLGMQDGQPDSYAYVGNNPVSYRDPLGLQMTPEQCAELLQQILKKTELLRDMIKRYDPRIDGIGGIRSQRSRRPTVPGGHFMGIINLQLRLVKDIATYDKECGPDDPNMPPCRELSKRPVPVPEIYPTTNPVPPGEQLVPLVGVLLHFLLRLAPVLAIP
jgi:RHS repeat-associated protein